MDLCGPMRVPSLGGNRYIYVLIDDFSRYTWTIFIKSKTEVFECFEGLVPLLEKSLKTPVSTIRSDHGTEFENYEFLTFCREHGIDHNFSAPYTPQQNGVVEENSSDVEEEEEDEMTALFTKHIKKKFIKRKFKPNFQKKDLKDYVCYQCNKKGHFAKNCPNGSGEEKQENKVTQENTFSRNKKKKALVAAWGSEFEEEPGSPKGERCLMARSNA